MSSTESKRQHSPSQPTGCWIRRERRLGLYIRDGFRCLYCGTDLSTVAPADITLDHLLPRSAGGTNANENLCTACRRCNSSRQDRPWADFAPGGAADRINQQRHKPVNLELARSILSGEQAALVADLEAAR